MDKYEYRLKAEQIEKLAGKKDYETAAKIADTIDWRRVKNLNMLYIVSDVYEAMERYEDCMEILNIAYDKASVGRMLLYKMTEIATKMHQFPRSNFPVSGICKGGTPRSEPLHFEISDHTGKGAHATGGPDPDSAGV